MKIAVASEGDYVSLHFGHCPEYRVFDVEEGAIKGMSVLPNPGHQPGVLPGFLKRHGVDCIIAGGMGPRAVELFRENDIEVVVGATGNVREIVEAYLNGTLETEGGVCQAHGHDESERRC